MPQSLVNNLLHIIFSTKERQPLIHPEIESRLHSYMVGIFKKFDSPVIHMGGTKDHVHVLCSLSKNHSLIKVIENVKKSSSKWVKTIDPKYKKFYWQKGYGAFSVSASTKDAVLKYIENQKEHHKKRTFQEEYREILGKSQIEFDERYIWD